MAQSRKELAYEVGGMGYSLVMLDLAELGFQKGRVSYRFEGEAFAGGSISRFGVKFEGEGAFGAQIEDIELQALYSRAIAPFFDLQAGVRQDIAGPDTTYAVVGVQGLAPYMFQVDGALFLSQRGDLTARVEVELEQRITQRLIVQPRAEINLSAQDTPRLGIGAGIDKVEIGVRLRYEIVREFAPYVGIEQSWRVGRSADFARTAGQDPSSTNAVVGVRFWF